VLFFTFAYPFTSPLSLLPAFLSFPGIQRHQLWTPVLSFFSLLGASSALETVSVNYQLTLIIDIDITHHN